MEIGDLLFGKSHLDSHRNWIETLLYRHNGHVKLIPHPHKIARGRGVVGRHTNGAICASHNLTPKNDFGSRLVWDCKSLSKCTS